MGEAGEPIDVMQTIKVMSMAEQGTRNLPNSVSLPGVYITMVSRQEAHLDGIALS